MHTPFSTLSLVMVDVVLTLVLVMIAHMAARPVRSASVRHALMLAVTAACLFCGIAAALVTNDHAFGGFMILQGIAFIVAWSFNLDLLVPRLSHQSAPLHGNEQYQDGYDAPAHQLHIV